MFSILDKSEMLTFGKGLKRENDCNVVLISILAIPVFTTPSVPGRSIQVAETVPAGTSVYRVVAIDADTDKLVYSVTSQIPAVPPKFTISSTTGVLSTLSEFDADIDGSILEYQLTIRCVT